MAGISRFIAWIRRRGPATSAVERLREGHESPLKVEPWAPEDRTQALPWEGKRSPGFRVVSLEDHRRKRASSKPRGLADEDWRTRNSA